MLNFLTTDMMESCLPGYKAVYSVESEQTFWRNILASSSGWKRKPIKKSA
jgi:hypothetical protein